MNMFNHEVIIDVFYIYDMARNLYGFLSIVDNGATYHSISLICEGQWDPQVFEVLCQAPGELVCLGGLSGSGHD